MPHVAILLGTVNGERYIDEQLESFAAQTHGNWSLVVSDDGSSDRTLQRVEAFAHRVGRDRVRIRSGPRKGFAANFLTLACDPQIEADYFAFSDQDDIWVPDKIARAVARMQALPAERAVLYGSRTEYIDENGRSLGLSPNYERAPAFGNALVQSLMGGNTMMLNRTARTIVMAMGVLPVVAHDWWFYQLISGCEGIVVFDREPTVRYRQHAGNVIGSNQGLPALAMRARELMKGRFSRWNELNASALQQARLLFTEENRRRLDIFLQGRRQGVFGRLSALQNAGVHRQTPLGNLGLWIAAATNRL